MGGIGSGLNVKIGTGPKPKGDKARWLGGNAGKRGGKAKAPVIPAVALIAAPADLPAAQRAVWNELAPHACAARTLVPGTASAFRQLCARIVLLHTIEAQIEADGIMGDKVTLQMDEHGGGLQQVEKKAHDLLTKAMTLMQRVDQGMLRFALSPMGKPLTPAEKKPDDAFAEFDEGTVQ